MNIRPYCQGDIAALSERMYIPPGEYDDRQFEASGLILTGVADGTVIGCGGLIKIWQGRYQGFLLLSQEVPLGDWIKITLHTNRLFKKARAKGMRRIEGHVDPAVLPNIQWAAKALKMELETPGGMKAWSPDGRTFLQFARTWS